ncbi:hypothetical protein [Mycobacterium riyadhense]|uniref:Uncharacterized protein n=1 Tax=Mycobacterium riyadhense TaxID=486698 RepID=A0A1X2CUJ6_9MYCO|nr:hypothetical protein [Mycobacterium riyadhense]MCV7145579.1 hypothetical protein [Mycobacterium riyadhense]ORW79567.1 hypothetical protein AWC22_18705 [Mycobacterium riyadhense]
MNQPMHFDIATFRDMSGRMAEDGFHAGNLARDATFSYSPAGGNSPTGFILSTGLGALQGDLALGPPGILDGAAGTDRGVQTGLSNIEGQDQTNAGRARLAKDPGDPESIEQQAADKAKEAAEKPEQMMQQMLQQMLQMAAQTGGQFGQQFGQLSQQFSQLFGQATQQMSQLFSQAGKAGASGVEPAVDAAAAGLDAAGAAGGGAGGAGLGVTMPAGLDEAVTPMTTSSALAPSAIPLAAGPQAASAAGRGGMPMMPMMPMAPHRGSGDGSTSVKRDPKIFPESKIYDPPKGTEQNFGANPEIEAEEPPFGTAKA